MYACSSKVTTVYICQFINAKEKELSDIMSVGFDEME